MPDRPLRIVFHNRPFDGLGVVPAACSTSAVFSHDGADRATADAVVFHIPTLDVRELDRLTKPAGQLWVSWSLESPVMYPMLADPAFMDRFDLTMSYERSSDVWHPYFGPALLDQLAEPIALAREATPVAWLQSNPHDATGRAAYAAELMRRVRVDSYGSILRNRVEDVPVGERRAQARVERYRRYKFVLAFENSFATDYVTERVYDVLRAGAVPVYRGCAEVAELLPSPHCFIDARSFTSATELGAHLDALDRDDAAYLELHRWRHEPRAEGFLELLRRLDEPPLCRLAREVARRRTEREV